MKINSFVLRTVIFFSFIYYGVQSICCAGDDNALGSPKKREITVNVDTEHLPPRKKIRKNLMAFYDGDPNPESFFTFTAASRDVPCNPRYAPTFQTSVYEFKSFDDVKSLTFQPTSTALVIDFDESFAQRIFKVKVDGGDSFEIRYASSGEWNSSMYERFFKQALFSMGKTTQDFDQLFQYFKPYVSYAVLDPSFLSFDLSNVREKIILSGRKTQPSKEDVYRKYGFSYAYSRNKVNKIASILEKDPLITHVIFLDNDPKNIQSVKKIEHTCKHTYEKPTFIQVDVVQYDYFKGLLQANEKELQSEIEKMFEFVEKNFQGCLKENNFSLNLLQDLQGAKDLQSCDSKAQETDT